MLPRKQDATPQNWLNNIPPEHQAIINAYITCPSPGNEVVLGSSNVELWSVIRFYTRPKWEYYSTWALATDVEVKLFGVGGELQFLCEFGSHKCTTGASFDIGPGAGLSVLGYKMKLSTALEFNVDSTGSVQVGGTADVGPCGLFVNFVRVSIDCTMPPMIHKEWGWTRGHLPQEYWAIVKLSAIGSLSYEEFAKLHLPFRGGSKIYYRVEATGSQDIAWRYLNVVDYVFQ